MKRLRLPDECVRRRNREVDPAALPDIIVHRRQDGPNILEVELKKTSNPAPRDCDRIRVHAFREQLEYEFGALIGCETRRRSTPAVRISEWVGDQHQSLRGTKSGCGYAKNAMWRRIDRARSRRRRPSEEVRALKGGRVGEQSRLPGRYEETTPRSGSYTGRTAIAGAVITMGG